VTLYRDVGCQVVSQKLVFGRNCLQGQGLIGDEEKPRAPRVYSDDYTAS